MTTAAVNVVSVQTPLPAGKTFAHWVIAVSDSASHSLSSTVDGVTTTSASFDISTFAPGPGTATVTAIAADGSSLAAANASFTIPAAPTFPAPTTVTVTVS